MHARVFVWQNPSCPNGEIRHFVAYTNGKSAVRCVVQDRNSGPLPLRMSSKLPCLRLGPRRLAEGVVPAGPHRFSSLPPARRLQSIAVSDREGSDRHSQPHPALLHFVNCGFGEYGARASSATKFSPAVPFSLVSFPGFCRCLSLGVGVFPWVFVACLSSRLVSDLRSQISDLRSQISDLRSQISDLRSQISDLRSHSGPSFAAIVI
eukprot:SAG22_NODE_1906_length_3335_cov_1.833127_5_plen_207_part_00